MLRLHILASGSGGNAAIVENAATGEGVLVDCGICKRDFFARAEEAGFNLEKLRAVVITHDHGDHTKGLGVVLRGLAKAGAHPAVCASEAVFAAPRLSPSTEAIGSIWPAWPCVPSALPTMRPIPTGFGSKSAEAVATPSAT